MTHRSFWRLLGYIRAYRVQVVFSILSNVLMAVFTVLSIPLISPFLEIIFQKDVQPALPPGPGWNVQNLEQHLNFYLTSMILEQGREKALLTVCGAILLVFFGKNLFRYLAMFFMAPTRNGIVRDVRAQLFAKLLRLPLGYFSEERKGDLMSRISGDVQEIEWSILNVLEAVFREPIIITLSLVYMVYISPELTGLVFLLIAFTGFVIGGIGRKLKTSSSQIQERLGNIVSVVEEALSGMRIVKGFNAEGYQERKFSLENNAYRRALTLLLWRKDLSSPLSEFLGITVVTLLLWFGSRQVFSGEMAAGAFFSFLFAFYNVIDPAKSFSRAFYDIQKGIAAMERIEGILDATTGIEEKPDARPIEHFQESIIYRGVSFQYRAEDGPVLRDINLEIPKGRVVAIVGPSGAGKSTLADLLPRFYDPVEGGIYIDGKDIRDLKLRALRTLMGIVSQEAILFNDTIYNNIVFGMENVGEEEVIRAAQIANAHNFIMATELGYQTNIGDRGTKLSGGQRQRLTIARAILKNPPILILDEATSALDSESEKLVQEALAHLMKDRTAIVIAHRLSTIQHADEIVVMKGGKIVQRGTHQDLMQVAGEYQKLVGLQAF
ncbi:MAG: ABC transporter ATP-binding protein [Saprospiraceae bacterium]